MYIIIITICINYYEAGAQNLYNLFGIWNFDGRCEARSH